MRQFPAIEVQHIFPREDLTDANAALLELLLCNREVVISSHATAEEVSWIFQVGHRVVKHVGAGTLEYGERLEALDYGTTIYEGMSTLLSATRSGADEYAAIAAQVQAWTSAGVDDAITHREIALATFHTDLPRTREVITAAAARLYPNLTEYALMGAALARQFELDCFEK